MREITTHKAHEQDRQPILTALGHPTIAGAELNYELCYSDADGLDVLVPINFVSLELPGVTNKAPGLSSRGLV